MRRFKSILIVLGLTLAFSQARSFAESKAKTSAAKKAKLNPLKAPASPKLTLKNPVDLSLENSDPKIAKILQDALKAKAEGRLEAGLKLLETAYQQGKPAYETYPEYVRTLIEIGLNLQDEKNTAAEKYFRDALRIATEFADKYPSKAEALFSKAAALGCLGLYVGGKEKVQIGWAIEGLARKGILLEPEYPFSYFALGVFYRELGNLTWFEKFMAQMLFGDLPKRDYEDSEEYLKKADELFPNFSITLIEMGRLYDHWGKKDKAIEYYSRVLHLPIKYARDPAIHKEAAERLHSLGLAEISSPQKPY